MTERTTPSQQHPIAYSQSGLAIAHKYGYPGVQQYLKRASVRTMEQSSTFVINGKKFKIVANGNDGLVIRRYIRFFGTTFSKKITEKTYIRFDDTYKQAFYKAIVLTANVDFLNAADANVTVDLFYRYPTNVLCQLKNMNIQKAAEVFRQLTVQTEDQCIIFTRNKTQTLRLNKQQTNDFLQVLIHLKYHTDLPLALRETALLLQIEKFDYDAESFMAIFCANDVISKNIDCFAKVICKEIGDELLDNFTVGLGFGSFTDSTASNEVH